MKHILAPIFLLVFLFPSLALSEEYLNEGQIENTWVVNVNEQRDEVNVSVNGEVVHGDRLRIRILKSRCDIGNTILTFLTDAKNPEIVNLEDVPTSAVFKNTDIKVRTLFSEKITPWGYMVTLDFGWTKIDDIKLFFSGEQISKYLLVERLIILRTVLGERSSSTAT